VIALAADSDGRVRRVPLMTRVATELRPGLALEVVRTAQRASSYLLLPSGWLRAGNVMVPVGDGGMLRLLPGPEPGVDGRNISAADVEQAGTRERLANRVVLIGGSAPELGGLRTASYGRLRPSVEIQADAVSQMLTGTSPRRPTALLLIELAACLIVGIGAFMAVHWLRPAPAALMMLSAGIGWLGLAATLVAFRALLLDPISVPTAGLVSYGFAMLFAASEARRREDALRRSFEQHLAPELVSRIVSDPGLVKLAGEQRVVTILFTDIEGFTAMTERTEPAALIGALDRYFEALSSIVVEHGGMVEKVVGDGVHALFNAPLDLPDHPDNAVDCAIAIQKFSDAFASEPGNAALAFGRTRIGVETGPVIVGDVGGGARLDYTAYGNAMNTAARLEAANKVTGTSICVGEATAALLADKHRLRPLGTLELRGRNEQLEVFDIWPPDMTEDQRVRHARACALLDDDPRRAIDMLRVIADERPHDAAISCLIERYGTGAHSPEPE
jgi:adenylate cyclase